MLIFRNALTKLCRSVHYAHNAEMLKLFFPQCYLSETGSAPTIVTVQTTLLHLTSKYIQLLHTA